MNMGFGCHQNPKSCHHPTLGHQDRERFHQEHPQNSTCVVQVSWQYLVSICHPMLLQPSNCEHQISDTFQVEVPNLCKYVSLHGSSEHCSQCQQHTCHWKLSWSRTTLSSTWLILFVEVLYQQMPKLVQQNKRSGHHTHVHTLPQKVWRHLSAQSGSTTNMHAQSTRKTKDASPEMTYEVATPSGKSMSLLVA